jgi:glycerol-3-phosphate dehydrogenase
MKRDPKRLCADHFDLLVIGGGIYGLFLAWDAAQRGLSVALVEKSDFGGGTSANTFRIIHGGLRYLQHGDIRRMRRSIRERTTFMQIAPHLVQPMPFLIPTYNHLMRGKEILAAALWINDLIALDRNRLDDPQKHLPRGRVISRKECLRLFPGVDEKGLTGAAIYYDCQMQSSERLVLAVARSAEQAGAVLCNYVKVTKLLKGGDRVSGVEAEDTLTGDPFEIRASVIVNTSGPWLDRVLDLLPNRSFPRRLHLSKAFNLLLERRPLSEYAYGLYCPRRFKDHDALFSKGYRLYFMAPWRERTLVGTVHLPYDADPDYVRVSEEEVETFLEELNSAYPAAGLKKQDVSFVYSGLLPAEKKLSPGGDVCIVKNFRIYDHRNGEGVGGLISVAGVKFTESRYVAEKTVDQVFKNLGKRAPKCRTSETPLHGGGIGRFNSFLTEASRSRPSQLGAVLFQNLTRRYGAAYPEVLKYFAPQHGDPPAGLLNAEVIYGVREEMAQKLADVVFRRTEMGLAPVLDNATLAACADAMAKELGWDAARREKEFEEVKAARRAFS